MGRRRKEDSIEDVVKAVSLLPWWACLAAAVIAYVLFTALAKPSPIVPAAGAQINEMIVRSMWKAFAGVARFVVPIICIAAAVLSAVRRRQRRTLFASVAQSQAPNALDGITWAEFEQLVGEAFRLQGYGIVETGGGGADGGVDLVLTKDREKYLVQCKQWKAFSVGVPVVRELYGAMAARGAAGGFVVTSGRFTAEATAFADGRNVKLVDGPKLFGLIQQAKAAGATTPSRRAASSMNGQPRPQPQPNSDATTAPTCPTCSSAMVRRTAKRGANAGRSFWGCSTYPACKGTRPVS